MKFELLTARRLHLGSDDNGASTSILNIATVGMILAIVVMLVSIAVVAGFKNEIYRKIFNLDAHVKISASANANQYYEQPQNPCIAVNELDSIFATQGNAIKATYPISEKEGILKTNSDFQGINFRGLTEKYDFSFIKESLIDGTLPNLHGETNTEVLVSSRIANDLSLKVGDKVLIYFIDDKVKVRNLKVSGIFSTEFEAFDSHIILGDARLVNEVNGWDNDHYSYLGITLNDPQTAKDEAYNIYVSIVENQLNNSINKGYSISNIQDANLSYFAWLGLLDNNAVIILILMAFVSGFTLVSGLIILVLDRIRTIGTLKALGATNSSIRLIFIFLTIKLIIKSMIIGNIIAAALILIQQHTHLIALNAEEYYMSFVPVEILPAEWIGLNLAILLFSFITLLLPSYIISTLKPAETIRFE